MEIPSDLRNEISEYLPIKDLIETKDIFPKNRYKIKIEKEKKMLEDPEFLIKSGMFYSAYGIYKDWDILVLEILDIDDYKMESLIELLDDIYNEGSKLKENVIDNLPREIFPHISKSTLVSILKEDCDIRLSNITTRADIVEIFKEDIRLLHLTYLLDILNNEEPESYNEIISYFKKEILEYRGERVAEILFYSNCLRSEILNILKVTDDKEYFSIMIKPYRHHLSHY